MMVKLDRRITIQRPISVKDPAYGAAKATWFPLAIVWAERLDELPSRSESIGNGMQESAQRTRYRIRWRSDIDTTMRVVEGDLVYQIVGGPAELGRKDYLELFCERYSADGTI